MQLLEASRLVNNSSKCLTKSYHTSTVRIVANTVLKSTVHYNTLIGHTVRGGSTPIEHGKFQMEDIPLYKDIYLLDDAWTSTLFLPLLLNKQSIINNPQYKINPF